MVKKVNLDMKHGDEFLIDKIIRIRYANHPESDEPTSSYSIIAKYLKVPLNTVT